jgi:hypothetical protein
MSAYSTLRITRSRAKNMIIQSMFGEIDDELLERYLDKLLEPRLYNARIVSDDDKNDDCEL